MRLIQSGPYGTPVNQIDFLGKLLSRSAYKNEGSITRGLYVSLSKQRFLYYDYNNQLPEAFAHSTAQPTKNKIILLIDQHPEAVTDAWEEFQKSPQGVTVYTPVYLQKNINDRFQSIYGYHLHSGIPFTPNTETEFTVFFDYSSSTRENIDLLKEAIIKFAENIINITNTPEATHSTNLIIKKLTLKIKEPSL